MPKIEGKVSLKMSVMTKEGLNEAEKIFSRIDSLKSEDRGLIKVIGQLYATAVSTETISLSYVLLWEILEVYSLTMSEPTPLLSKKTINKIEKLLSNEGYVEKDIGKVVSFVSMLGESTQTEIISESIQQDLFPEKDLNEVNAMLRDLRKTRNIITHPKVFKEIDNATILAHYGKLKEIVSKLLIHLAKRVAG
jgi:hypothetical protein